MLPIDPSLSLADFDYELPEHLIAQTPPATRTDSRLLHMPAQGELQDLNFSTLPDLLMPGDLLVFNDTKVIKARLYGQKDSGGRIEALIERILEPTRALAHIRASKAPRAGVTLIFDDAVRCQVTGRQDDLFELQFEDDILPLLDKHGNLPLPPYIKHSADEQDESRYQTVYARHPGAVAAPTAGLHFDAGLLERLRDKGIETAWVTLHVGAGTFQPVRVEKINEHIMHSEWYTVPQVTVSAIEATRQRGGRVIAVGTTSVRALESAAQQGGTVNDLRCPVAHSADTQLFITPGYQFRVIDGLITNFHLPQSTLLMLVSALTGRERMQQAYHHAIEQQYRFFSYGDAMFIAPSSEKTAAAQAPAGAVNSAGSQAAE